MTRLKNKQTNKSTTKNFQFCFRLYNGQTARGIYCSDLPLLPPLPVRLSSSSPIPFTSQAQSSHRILITVLSYVPVALSIIQRLLTTQVCISTCRKNWASSHRFSPHLSSLDSLPIYSQCHCQALPSMALSLPLLALIPIPFLPIKLIFISSTMCFPFSFQNLRFLYVQSNLLIFFPLQTSLQAPLSFSVSLFSSPHDYFHFLTL